MTISNKTYDKLKWVALIVLPGIATLYLALSQTWGFPYGEQISTTITAIDTFIGVLLGVSSKGYASDGVLTISSDEGGTTLDNLQFNDPDTFAEKDKVVLDVNKAKHLKA